jgi:hypothetical protein
MHDIGNPISRIQKAFGGEEIRHIGWDFAAECDWRNSESFLFEDQKKSSDIFSWLGKQTTPDIACEALFQLKNGERFFFGFSTVHLSDLERKRVISELLEIPHDGRSLIETVDEIRKAFRSNLPLDTTPQKLVLGVGGLWKNVGPLEVSNKKNGIGTILPFEEIQAHAPSPNKGFFPLYEPQQNNIMLEADMCTDGTFKCWLGIRVSESDEGPSPKHRLSKDRYYSVARTLSGCSLGS